MAFKPNRPIRVGTEKLRTDEAGNVPGREAADKGHRTAQSEDRVDPTFLDRPVAEILPDLKGKSMAELRAVYDAERHGKTRKSLMRPLEEMIGPAE